MRNWNFLPPRHLGIMWRSYDPAITSDSMSISSSILTKAAVPAFALVLGVVAGRSSLFRSAAGSAGDFGEAAHPRSMHADGPRDSLGSRHGGSRAERERKSGSPSVAAALGMRGQSGRMRSLLSMLDRVAPGEFPAVLEEMRNAGLDIAFPAETLLVLSAWADRDPMAAAEHLREAGGDPAMKNAVMASWAAADPKAAERWARDHHDSEDANPWLVGVIQGIASSDVELARTLVEELPRGRERNQALASTLGQVFLHGGESAAAWINGLGDARIQNEGAEWLAERMADRDPVAAAAWVSSLETADARGDAAEEVASRYARHDLESAQAWVLTLPDDARTGAVKGVVDQLARQNPAAAFNWLSTLGGGEEMDGLRRDIVRRGFNEDPAAALTTALHLQDDRDREKFTSRYLDRWVEADPAAASRWLDTHSIYLPEDTRVRHAPEK